MLSFVGTALLTGAYLGLLAVAFLAPIVIAWKVLKWLARRL